MGSSSFIDLLNPVPYDFGNGGIRDASCERNSRFLSVLTSDLLSIGMDPLKNNKVGKSRIHM